MRPLIARTLLLLLALLGKERFPNDETKELCLAPKNTVGKS